SANSPSLPTAGSSALSSPASATCWFFLSHTEGPANPPRTIALFWAQPASIRATPATFSLLRLGGPLRPPLFSANDHAPHTERPPICSAGDGPWRGRRMP